MNPTQIQQLSPDTDSDDERVIPPPPPANNDEIENETDDDNSDSDTENIRPPPPEHEDDDEDDDDDDDDEDSENSDADEDDEPKDIFTRNTTPTTKTTPSNNQITNIDYDTETDDDNDDEDDNYLQKFNENLQQQIIADYHPEMKSHNYDEITTLSKVVRNEVGAIVDPLHRSVPFITRYEKAKIIGERAAQLSAGAVPLIEVEDNVIDDYIIATNEFNQKKIPFIIKRPMPNGGCEYWRMEDLEILV